MSFLNTSSLILSRENISIDDIFPNVEVARLKLNSALLPISLKDKIKSFPGAAYITRIGDSWFLYRPLIYSDFKISKKILNSSGIIDARNFVIQKCLEYPEDPSKVLTCYIDKVADQIFEISGFNNEVAFHDGLLFSRQELQTIDGALDTLLKSTFFMKEEEMNKLTFLERMQLAAYSEILNKKSLLPEEQKSKKRNTVFNEETFEAPTGKGHSVFETTRGSVINTKYVKLDE